MQRNYKIWTINMESRRIYLGANWTAALNRRLTMQVHGFRGCFCLRRGSDAVTRCRVDWISPDTKRFCEIGSTSLYSTTPRLDFKEHSEALALGIDMVQAQKNLRF